LFEEKWKLKDIPFKKELKIGDSGNIADFVIDDKIILEFKAVAFLLEEHFDQVKRYLHQTQLKVGIIVNFRDKRIKPLRVLNPNNLMEK
jgi:GxxExxY protein